MKSWPEKLISRKGTVLLLTACMLLASVTYSYIPRKVKTSDEVTAVRQYIRENKYVIHGGGYLITTDGDFVSVTNSFESLMNAFDQGNRVFEFDIRETADGVLVCAHGDDICFTNGSDLPSDTDFRRFAEALVYGEFHTMSLKTLTDFMKQHEDILVVTDVKDSNLSICRRIAEAYPELIGRFVVQIYYPEEYDSIRAMGFQNIIFSVYRTGERNIWEISDFALNHELVAVTFPAAYFSSFRIRSAMACAGVPFMFFTVNEKTEMERMLSKHYILGVYTDCVIFD